jgi:prepilin-type N-terminal cleavage/methylation domain-containing protein
MTPIGRAGRGRGLALIELLVVISIIGPWRGRDRCWGRRGGEALDRAGDRPENRGRGS